MRLVEHAELIVDAKVQLGEGPSWDARNRVLYWVDILGKQVHIYDPAKKTDRTIDVPGLVGSVVPRASGGLIAALQDGFYSVDTETGKSAKLAAPAAMHDKIRFNDGKCDAAGRFLAGTMSLEGEKKAGELYSLHDDLSIETLVSPVTTSNGLAWSPDHRVLYYIDTPTKQVVAYDYDLSKGTISGKRVVIQIPDGQGVPDGMTSDTEGMLWVAQWDGFRLSRWNPAIGERLLTIQLPAARITSCVFAGEQMDELYITTASTGLSDQAKAEQPHAGGLFYYKAGVRGMPTYAFNG
jgi:sugar lactone lactonase YvrE